MSLRFKAPDFATSVVIISLFNAQVVEQSTLLGLGMLLCALVGGLGFLAGPGMLLCAAVRSLVALDIWGSCAARESLVLE